MSVASRAGPSAWGLAAQAAAAAASEASQLHAGIEASKVQAAIDASLAEREEEELRRTLELSEREACTSF